MPVLSTHQVYEHLKAVPEWNLVEGEIVREMRFQDFPAAMRFVNQVAGLAEAAGHHPDIDIRYNKVRLTLVSHDAGGLTERDFSVAAGIDALDSSK